MAYNRLIPSLRMSSLISFVIEDGSEKLKKRCHLPPIANPLKFYFFSPLLFSDVSSSLNLLLSLTSTQQEVTESSLKISETRCTCCNEQDIFGHFARIGEDNSLGTQTILRASEDKRSVSQSRKSSKKLDEYKEEGHQLISYQVCNLLHKKIAQ